MQPTIEEVLAAIKMLKDEFVDPKLVEGVIRAWLGSPANVPPKPTLPPN